MIRLLPDESEVEQLYLLNSEGRDVAYDAIHVVEAFGALTMHGDRLG
jgi:hypothetical protein